jgi:hypothetical protein
VQAPPALGFASGHQYGVQWSNGFEAPGLFTSCATRPRRRRA